MTDRPYVELHGRSAFSFLEGASLPEELASRCAGLGQPALAITDTHGVYGAPRFHLAAAQLGIRALVGAEVEAAEGGRYTLLAEARTGYQNLCRLITRAHLREEGPGKTEHPVATPEDSQTKSGSLGELAGCEAQILGHRAIAPFLNVKACSYCSLA